MSLLDGPSHAVHRRRFVSVEACRLVFSESSSLPPFPETSSVRRVFSLRPHAEGSHRRTPRRRELSLPPAPSVLHAATASSSGATKGVAGLCGDSSVGVGKGEGRRAVLRVRSRRLQPQQTPPKACISEARRSALPPQTSQAPSTARPPKLATERRGSGCTGVEAIAAAPSRRRPSCPLIGEAEDSAVIEGQRWARTSALRSPAEEHKSASRGIDAGRGRREQELRAPSKEPPVYLSADHSDPLDCPCLAVSQEGRETTLDGFVAAADREAASLPSLLPLREDAPVLGSSPFFTSQIRQEKRQGRERKSADLGLRGTERGRRGEGKSASPLSRVHAMSKVLDDVLSQLREREKELPPGDLSSQSEETQKKKNPSQAQRGFLLPSSPIRPLPFPIQPSEAPPRAGAEEVVKLSEDSMRTLQLQQHALLLQHLQRGGLPSCSALAKTGDSSPLPPFAGVDGKRPLSEGPKSYAALEAERLARAHDFSQRNQGRRKGDSSGGRNSSAERPFLPATSSEGSAVSGRLLSIITSLPRKQTRNTSSKADGCGTSSPRLPTKSEGRKFFSVDFAGAPFSVPSSPYDQKPTAVNAPLLLRHAKLGPLGKQQILLVNLMEGLEKARREIRWAGKEGTLQQALTSRCVRVGERHDLGVRTAKRLVNELRDVRATNVCGSKSPCPSTRGGRPCRRALGRGRAADRETRRALFPGVALASSGLAILKLRREGRRKICSDSCWSCEGKR